MLGTWPIHIQTHGLKDVIGLGTRMVFGVFYYRLRIIRSSITRTLPVLSPHNHQNIGFSMASRVRRALEHGATLDTSQLRTPRSGNVVSMPLERREL